MNLIAKLALFCLLTVLLKTAIQVLLVLLAIVWIYAFIVKPAETIGFLFLLTLAACIRTHPGWSFLLIGSIAAASLIMHNNE
ncbi:hypothetical protein A8B75_15010 [Sphingomonadales bacterium EhC05]|nr:hypothetical protein A8B75_15010 [Sphingomonadales bacterium EhC05]